MIELIYKLFSQFPLRNIPDHGYKTGQFAMYVPESGRRDVTINTFPIFRKIIRLKFNPALDGNFPLNFLIPFFKCTAPDQFIDFFPDCLFRGIAINVVRSFIPADYKLLRVDRNNRVAGTLCKFREVSDTSFILLFSFKIPVDDKKD